MTKLLKKRIIEKVTTITLLFFLSTATAVFGETQGYSEYKIKAGYIYNFARFVKWPEESFEGDPDSFHLCLINGDPFGNQFKRVEGKVIGGKKLTIKRLNPKDNLKQCQILFIPAPEINRMSHIIESLEDSHVLTVADVRNFHKVGGMISLRKKGDRIKLEINLNATKQKKLLINAKLLEIATIVDRN